MMSKNVESFLNKHITSIPLLQGIDSHLKAASHEIEVNSNRMNQINHRLIQLEETIAIESKQLTIETENISRKLQLTSNELLENEPVLQSVAQLASTLEIDYKDLHRLEQEKDIQELFIYFNALIKRFHEITESKDIVAHDHLRTLCTDYSSFAAHLTGLEFIDSSHMKRIESLKVDIHKSVKKCFSILQSLLRRGLSRTHWFTKPVTVSIFEAEDNPELSELCNILIDSLCIAGILPGSTLDNLKEVFKPVLLPLYKKFSYHFGNVVSGSEDQKDCLDKVQQSHWMFVFVLNWFSENQQQFLLQDLKALQNMQQSYLKESSSCPASVKQIYLNMVSEMLGIICIDIVSKMNDWLASEFLMDALKFDLLFNETFGNHDEKLDNYTNGGVATFQFITQRQPKILPSMIKVERYKTLAYLNVEILQNNQAFYVPKLIENEQLTQDVVYSRPSNRFLCKINSLYVAPFLCVQLFLYFLDILLRDQYEFLLQSFKPIYDQIYMDILKPLVETFVKFLTEAVDSYAYDDAYEFLIYAAISIDTLLNHPLVNSDIEASNLLKSTMENLSRWVPQSSSYKDFSQCTNLSFTMALEKLKPFVPHQATN